jgi:diaminopropionate ammonia-lyase
MQTSQLSETWKRLWPDHRPTSLIELPALARFARVGRVFVKAESERPLGSFKSLGGMTAGLRALARHAGVTDLLELCSGKSHRDLPTLICASEGNHGLAIATAAQTARTRARIHLPKEVSSHRASRIEACGAEIVWITGTYDDAVLAAEAAAHRGDGLLISDTSADPNDAVVADVMEGYGLLAQEVIDQFDELRERPSHLFVQAGVGGLAAAMIAGLNKILRAPKKSLVVEPESAPCVAQALATARPIRVDGDLHTAAEMLACGVASAPALRILQQHPVDSVLVPETELQLAATAMRSFGGPQTTASGACGLAGLLRVAARDSLRAEHRLGSDSTVILFATERSLGELSI